MLEPDRQKTKNVIVCADDFAVNASVSLGIAELASLGRISATSVMVLSERWPQDVAMLRPLRDRIDVGLHLDWTSEFACVAGHGISLGAAMRRALLFGFDYTQASSVIELQLDLFEAHWQAPPDYVDGHQHVQQFDGIRQALVDVLVRRYADQLRKPYLRISRPPSGCSNLKSLVIAWMGANALEVVVANACLTSTKALLGVYDLKDKPARYGHLMERWLALSPNQGIIMCHPALAIEPGDEIGAARVQEYAYLAGTGFAAALQQAQVRLVRGIDVGTPAKIHR